MIDCKFSKDELIFIVAALKVAVNRNMDEMIETNNNFESLYGDESNILKDSKDLQNYVNELRYNIKSLIRNN